MDYHKDFGCLTDTVISVLASGKFPTDDAEKWNKYLADTNGGDRVLAVIQYPTIDIELEAYTGSGNEPWSASESDNNVLLDYYVCIKGVMHTGNIEWCSDDFVPWDVMVDFGSANCEEALERDMLNALSEYARNNGYSFTELNFNDCREVKNA